MIASGAARIFRVASTMGIRLYEEKRMKVIYLALLLCVFSVGAVEARAGGTILEADYPNQYEVLNTSKTSKMIVQKSCSMTLRDRAKANVALNVAKKGSCHALDGGKLLRGRENQKKNQIELVVPEGEDKARVENWEIIGTVNMTPGPAPAS
jgi:hypothetical protein